MRRFNPTLGLVLIFAGLFAAMLFDEHHASFFAAGASASVAPSTQSAPSRTRGWYPRGPIDEAMFQQLRKPWLSPGERTRFLAKGGLRVGTAEFGALLKAARAEEKDVREGLRPALRRSMLCGELVCAPLFALAE